MTEILQGEREKPFSLLFLQEKIKKLQGMQNFGVIHKKPAEHGQ